MIGCSRARRRPVFEWHVSPRVRAGSKREISMHEYVKMHAVCLKKLSIILLCSDTQ